MNNQSVLANEKYRSISNDKLIEIFSLGYKRLKKAIDGLSLDEMRERPIAGKWSVMELVHHLADSEIMGNIRIRQLAAEEKPTFAFYNQDQFAIKLDYNNRSKAQLKNSLKLFKYLRKTTTDLFKIVADNEWSKEGHHPENGNMSLRLLLEDYAEHSELHIGHILKRREKLGKPIDLKSLLEI